MCTIMTFDNSFDKQVLVNHILEDSLSNADGYSLLMVLTSGKPMVLRSMDVDAIVDAVWYMEWERVFIHTRYATQGEALLQNTHGWNSDGTFVMHNGYIAHPDSENFEVDSQAIVHWLGKHTRKKSVKKILAESYANVLLVDTETNDYVVVRSKSGSLFTDGHGNYSTNPVGTVTMEVLAGHVKEYPLGLIAPEPKRVSYATGLSDHWRNFETLGVTSGAWDDYDDLNEEKQLAVDDHIRKFSVG